jgi:hypothetical protein
VISRDNEKLLRDSYDTVMADVISLENNIEASQLAFHQQIEAAREVREARRLGKHISTVEGVVIAGKEQTSITTVGVVVTTVEDETRIVEGEGGREPDGAAEKVDKDVSAVEKVVDNRNLDRVEVGRASVEDVTLLPVGGVVTTVEDETRIVEGEGGREPDGAADKVDKDVSAVEKVVDNRNLDRVEVGRASVEEVTLLPVGGVVTTGEDETRIVEGVVASVPDGAAVLVDKDVSAVEKVVDNRNLDRVEVGRASVVEVTLLPVGGVVTTGEDETRIVEGVVAPVPDGAAVLVDKDVSAVEKVVDNRNLEGVEVGMASVEGFTLRPDGVKVVVAPVEEVIEELSSETGEAVSPLPEIIASKKRALDDQKDTHLKDNIPIANDPSQVSLGKVALPTTKKRNKLSLRRKVTNNQGVAPQHEPSITQGLGLHLTAVRLGGEATVGKEDVATLIDKEYDPEQTAEKERLQLADFLTTRPPPPTFVREGDGKAKKRKSKKCGTKKTKKLLSGSTTAISIEGAPMLDPKPPAGHPWAGYSTTETGWEEWPYESTMDGNPEDWTHEGRTHEDQESWDNVDNNEWYWDHEFGNWVYTGPSYIKRIRRKDLSNKMEKNWRLGMRRNWNTPKKEKMLAKITITRDNMNLVITYIYKPM